MLLAHMKHSYIQPGQDQSLYPLLRMHSAGNDRHAQDKNTMMTSQITCAQQTVSNLPFQEFGKLFGSLRRSLERSSKSLQEFGLSLAEY